MTADAQKRREEMLARRERVVAENLHITLARDVAPLMGDLEQEYWNWSLERLLAEEGVKDVTETPEETTNA